MTVGELRSLLADAHDDAPVAVSLRDVHPMMLAASLADAVGLPLRAVEAREVSDDCGYIFEIDTDLGDIS